MRVLLADDQALSLDKLRNLLVAHGTNVAGAASAGLGLSLLSSTWANIVLISGVTGGTGLSTGI